MEPRHEIAVHVGCLLTGIVAFIIFYSVGHGYYTEYRETREYVTQQAALTSYALLVTTFVQVWLFLLLSMVCIWSYQREFKLVNLPCPSSNRVHRIHHPLASDLPVAGLACHVTYAGFVLFARLKKEWDGGLDEATSDWDRDLWKTEDSYIAGQRANKRRLLDLIAEGYDEIVRPLEPYVATFVLFGAPAVLMATNWCERRSLPKTADLHVNCQHGSEMVLALRTLATVGIYFRDQRSRRQLWRFGELRRRAWQRLRLWFAAQGIGATPAVSTRGRGRRVRITSAEDEVKIIERAVFTNDDFDNDEGSGTAYAGNVGVIEG